LKLKFVILVTLCCCAVSLRAQNTISIKASLKADQKSINIQQEIEFVNNSNTALNEIYLNDWANSFSAKTTPLGKRFSENYDSGFHFEKDEDRGKTTIFSIVNKQSQPITWNRKEYVDIIKITPEKTIQPGESYLIKLIYSVKLPDTKFTRYGVTKSNNYKLKYWYISPAVYDGSWKMYSNKNTDDLFLNPSHFSIEFKTPANYSLTSSLDVVSENTSEGIKTTILEGENRTNADIYLEHILTFETVVTDRIELITNIKDSKVSAPIHALTVDRITRFLTDKLGSYPFTKMVISEADYKSNPVYGLNQLPNFISPFPVGFENDMQLLKSMSRKYIENTIHLNPRNEYWLHGGIQIYLMMEYVNTYYPKMKIIGSLSNFWIIKWANGAKLEFNDQYPLLYMNMARSNLNQRLTTPKDSLLKFNMNIANDYYAGNGLKYLSDYIGKENLDKSIKQFYEENKLKPVTASKFEETISKNTTLPVNWFFDNYIDTRTPIDFKIKKVKKRGDSLEVVIKNFQKKAMPVSVYGIDKDSVVFKKWSQPFDSIITAVVPAENVKKLALNYETVIPEYNRRNNYKNLNGLLNRPVQFRLFQDVEDPKYNQLFFMPVFEYNLYDGISIGPKLYNKTVLPKGLYYKLEPQYGFTSKTIIGSGSISYTQRVNEENLYAMRYGISGNRYSYNEGLFYRKFTPYMSFAFRNKDLRDNEKQYINLRNVNVIRDDNPADPNQDPSYSVFNFQYVYSNPNLINYFRGSIDYQISQKFSKISTTFEYRKLFINNRQLNVRLFAGLFLFNDTRNDDDFFSFALDRPTDYMFDYNYYGRSEDTGLFSQQLVVAEGGFKSQLEPAFANSWITTLNASTNIWKWIYAYGDAGLVHNKERGTKAVFDTGVRVSLVTDYFELYFPLYSNLGWEPGLDNYDQKIRFIVTLDISTLLGLFTREWY